MNKTNIEYLDYSWNPIAMRCTKMSKGCEHCWHLRMCDRLARNPTFPPEVRFAYAGQGPPVLIQERLHKPLSRKKPAMIGVQFMGDLFHRKVSLTFVKRIWSVMAVCSEHTFVILTKRVRTMEDTVNTFVNMGNPVLPNVWLGPSVEDQLTADERIPFVLRTPAAKRIVSVEPMLAEIDIHPYTTHNFIDEPELSYRGIDWVIAGCESGPGRRPAPRGGFISLRDQCVSAGIPFFLKQMEIDGKVVKMPELDGQVWDLFPGEPVAGG